MNMNTLLLFLLAVLQYVFLTMEAMIDAGVHMGFPRDMATKLVLATLRGSSSYALQSHSSVQTLKSNVSNPVISSLCYIIPRCDFARRFHCSHRTLLMHTGDVTRRHHRIGAVRA